MSEFYDDGYWFDLRPEQRFLVEQLDEGEWAVHDTCADGEESYLHPVRGCETQEEAQEMRRRLIHRESLEDPF